MENGTIRLSSIANEQFVPSIEMGRLLGVSDNELHRLARSNVLVRRPDPFDARAFCYPVYANITRYLTHLRSHREKDPEGSSREGGGRAGGAGNGDRQR